jgi:[protein-PII] uridylyltransferase
MARLAEVGRAIAWTSDESWHEIKLSLSGAFFDRFRRERRLDDGLVLRDARVCMVDEGYPVTDPTMVLRVALAAARQRTRISLPTIELLTEAPPLPQPWPDVARTMFCDLLLCGPGAIETVETLDQWGLWEALVPEWAPNRSRPQRNAFHRWTVDRHLLECASEAAALAQRVPRPDLLVMAALLHDMGKGYPGDHSSVGAEMVPAICARMGFSEEDTATIAMGVRHHLLLPEIATRRDLDDLCDAHRQGAQVSEPDAPQSAEPLCQCAPVQEHRGLPDQVSGVRAATEAIIPGTHAMRAAPSPLAAGTQTWTL